MNRKERLQEVKRIGLEDLNPCPGCNKEQPAEKWTIAANGCKCMYPFANCCEYLCNTCLYPKRSI